jgi:hypothetical protein
VAFKVFQKPISPPAREGCFCCRPVYCFHVFVDKVDGDKCPHQRFEAEAVLDTSSDSMHVHTDSTAKIQKAIPPPLLHLAPDISNPPKHMGRTKNYVTFPKIFGNASPPGGDLNAPILELA